MRSSLIPRSNPLLVPRAILLPRRRTRAITLVLAFADLLDELAAERRDVVGLAARDDAAVDHHLLVDPARAGVLEIGLERRPRGDLQALDRAGFDERPRSVADHADRLARIDET